MLFSIVVCSTVHQFAQRDERRVPVAPGSGSALASPERTRNASNSSGVVRAGARQLQHDFDVLLFARDVEQIHRLAADGDAQRLAKWFRR